MPTFFKTKIPTSRASEPDAVQGLRARLVRKAVPKIAPNVPSILGAFPTSNGTDAFAYIMVP